MNPQLSTPPRSSSPKDMLASPTTPKKKNFLNKLLRRRSGSQNSTDSMDKRSATSKGSSENTTLVESAKRDTGTIRSESNSRSSSRRNMWIDEDETSIYNYADNEISKQFSDSGSSDDEDSIYSTHSSKSDDLKIEDDFQSNLDLKVNDYFQNYFGETEKNVWEGLTCEALVTPKYIKTVRKSRHSPKSLRHLFLAQELKVNDEDDDNLNSNSIDETVAGEKDNASHTSEEEKSHKNYNDSSKSNKHEIFVMKFSKDGKFLATAGRDSIVRVWKAISSPLSRLEFKEENKSDVNNIGKKKSNIFESASIFHEKPIRVFKGHTHSILSLDWSKNNFLLTGSMDRTAKLWHVERSQCLDTFQHEDFVTTVNFHPNDDRFFLSGSVDSCVRLWSILEKDISYSRNLEDDVLITSSSFSPNGSCCIIGGLNGTVIALDTVGLHMKKRLELKNRTIAHPFNRYGNKITGFQMFENEYYNANDPKQSELDKWNVLITTNDSKIRLVNTGSRKLVTRFKGLSNNSSSIVASISDDHRYIISGSEDNWCYIWENNNAIINNKLRNGLKELLMDGKQHLNDYTKKKHKYSKIINENKLFKKLNIHKFLDEDDGTSEYVSNENNSYVSFHSHNSKVNCAIFAPDITRKAIALSDDIIYDLQDRGRLASKQGVRNMNGKTFNPTTQNDFSQGQIIITADQTGVVRVFRQDSAYETRNYLLGYGRNRNHQKSCKVASKVSNYASNDGRDCISKISSPVRSLSTSSNNLKSRMRLRSKTNGSLPDSPRIGATGMTSSHSSPAVPKTVSSNSLIAYAKSQKSPLSNNVANYETRLDVHEDSSDSHSETSDVVSNVGTEERLSQVSSKAAYLDNVVKKAEFPFTSSKHSSGSIPLIVNTKLDDNTEEIINFVTPRKSKGNVESYLDERVKYEARGKKF